MNADSPKSSSIDPPEVLHPEEPASAQDLLAFVRFCQTVRNFKQPAGLLDAVVRLVPRLLGARGSIALMMDLHTHELYIPAAFMEDAALAQRLKSIRIGMDKISSQDTFQSRTPLIDHAWKNCPPGFEALYDHTRGVIFNRLEVPLLADEDVIGAVWAVNKIDGQFATEDTNLMEALAGVTAAALAAMAANRQLADCSRNTLDLDQARNRAAHHLSHAIKTPLAVLIASLKLLEKHLKCSPLGGWQTIFQRAQRNLDRLLTVEYEVEDILRQRDDTHGKD